MTEPISGTQEPRFVRLLVVFCTLGGLICLAILARGAVLGEAIPWWNWVLPGFFVLNGAVLLIPALRRRNWIQVGIYLVGFAAAVSVVIGISQGR